MKVGYNGPNKSNSFFRLRSLVGRAAVFGTARTGSNPVGENTLLHRGVIGNTGDSGSFVQGSSPCGGNIKLNIVFVLV